MTNINEMGIKQNVIEEIKGYARQYGLTKVIVFGSRARGDYKEKSDIDLAVTGGDVIGFSLAVDEYTSTLLKFDIVNLDVSVQEELRQSIKQEGVVIYEEV